MAHAMSAPDDKVLGVVYGPGLSRGMPDVHKDSGGLLAPILRLPPSPSVVASKGRRPSRGDFGGRVLAVS